MYWKSLSFMDINILQVIKYGKFDSVGELQVFFYERWVISI